MWGGISLWFLFAFPWLVILSTFHIHTDHLSYLEKYLFRSSTHFFMECLFLFYWTVSFFLLILDINSLSDIWFVNIFFLFQILQLDFVHYFICCEKLFYVCSLNYFCFDAFAFGVKSKKLLPKLILKNSLIVFSYF